MGAEQRVESKRADISVPLCKLQPTGRQKQGLLNQSLIALQST